MKKVTFSVTYEVGDKIKHDGGYYKVIGYEFVPKRGTRYIVMSIKNGTPEWTYLYDFELKGLD